jgi:hypothetical protein
MRTFQQPAILEMLLNSIVVWVTHFPILVRHPSHVKTAQHGPEMLLVLQFNGIVRQFQHPHMEQPLLIQTMVLSDQQSLIHVQTVILFLLLLLFLVEQEMLLVDRYDINCVCVCFFTVDFRFFSFQWAGAATCSATPGYCPTLTNPQDGSFSYSDNARTIGITATYTCANGFTLNGKSGVGCLAFNSATGQWNGTAPTCTKTPSYCTPVTTITGKEF